MSISPEHLFKCRAVIARLGEMDMAGWWNTNGLLGPLGAATLRRNFAKSHWFAQARAVSAVATARCQEVFPVPEDCISIWQVPPAIEDEIEQQWPVWLKACDEWGPFFQTVSQLQERDPIPALLSLGLADERDADAARRLRRSHDFRAVLVGGVETLDDRSVAQLSLAFAHSEGGKLAVPYMRWTTRRN
jgi:hypothetical protein